MMVPLHHWLYTVHEGLIAERASCLILPFRESEQKRWALIAQDPVLFAVAFLALLHENKTILLLPNHLPGTLEHLKDHYDAIATDVDLSFSGKHTVNLRDEFQPWQGEFHHINPELPCLSFFTSGSTGQPKEVTKCLRQLETEIQIIENLWGGLLQEGPVYSTVSHHHIYGLLFRLLWPLCRGLDFHRRFFPYPEALLSEMQATIGGALVSSPAQLEMMPELISLKELSERCPVIFSSGGPLRKQTAERFNREFGKAPIEIFGSTETGGIAYRQYPKNIWRCFDGIDIRFDSGTNRINIRSPYLPNPILEYSSEDRGLPAAEGGFTLLPRADRIVKISETRISLFDVEHRLREHPWVEDCIVATLELDSIGKRTVLGVVVVLTAEGRFQIKTQPRQKVAKELSDTIRKHFDSVARPRRWRYCTQLPINPQGKYLMAEVRAILEQPAEAIEHFLPEAEVLERTEDQVRLALKVREGLVYLPDHFPQMAVVPGVVLLDWVVQFAEASFSICPEVLSMNRVKFQQILLPGNKCELYLEWEVVDSRLGFRYENEGQLHASGTLMMRNDLYRVMG